MKLLTLLLAATLLVSTPTSAVGQADPSLLRASYCLGVTGHRIDSMKELGRVFDVDVSDDLKRLTHEAGRLGRFVMARVSGPSATQAHAALNQGQADGAQLSIDIRAGCHDLEVCEPWLAANSAAYRATQRCNEDNGMPY